MLPFMQPKKITSVLVGKKNPDSSLELEASEEMDAGIMSAAEDLIRAVHSKDAKAVAGALQSAFEMMDAMPHEEGPHLDEMGEE